MEGGSEGTETGRHIHLILIAGDPVYIHAIYVNFVNIQDSVRNIVKRSGTLEFVLQIGNTKILQVYLYAAYTYLYMFWCSFDFTGKTM